MLRKALQAAICAVLCALLAPAAAQALSAAQLRDRLAAESRRLGSASGAEVRDLTTGEVLYSRKAGVPRVPASNEKLLVTAAALLELGPALRLRTTVEAAAGPDEKGVVSGDVALVGAGDPYLTSSQLRTAVSQLRALGVRVIRGRVLGDGSLFDARRGSYDSGYAYDDDLGGSLGGLVVDRGRGADPGLYAAQRLRAELVRSGVSVRGASASGGLPGPGVVLAGVSSVPLSTIALRINVPSDNWAAEMLLKLAGASFGTGGTTTAGAAAVRATLAGLGVVARPYDGSGLSRANHVSPHEVVDLLAEMAELRGTGLALKSSLAVVGRTGTLADRMRGSIAQGRCRGKTGTLRGVSALSGYCSTTGGRLVAFSFMENTQSEYEAKRIEDRMVPLVARFG